MSTGFLYSLGEKGNYLMGSDNDDAVGFGLPQADSPAYCGHLQRNHAVCILGFNPAEVIGCTSF